MDFLLVNNDFMAAMQTGAQLSKKNRTSSSKTKELEASSFAKQPKNHLEKKSNFLFLPFLLSAKSSFDHQQFKANACNRVACTSN